MNEKIFKWPNHSHTSALPAFKEVVRCYFEGLIVILVGEYRRRQFIAQFCNASSEFLEKRTSELPTI